MKVKLFILFGLLEICSSSFAQDMKLDVKSQSLSIQGDSLVVSLKMVVQASGLGTKSYVSLVPVVKGEMQSKELLPVWVNGKKRNRLYERTLALEKRKGIKPAPVYAIIESEGNTPKEISYRTSVTLEDWMNTASLTIRKKYIGDSGELISDNVIVIESPVTAWSSPVQKKELSLSSVSEISDYRQSVGKLQKVKLVLKGSYISPESDAIDTRNQKELNFSLDEARVVAELNPQMLSMRELFMVANSYKGEPSKFYSTIETCVKVYPANPIANLNAAAAAIEQGYIEAAGNYLKMASYETVAYKNCRGAYELMCGNLYEGIRLLKLAKAEGSEEAEMNLKLFFEENKR